MSPVSANATALPDRRAFLSTIAGASALGLPVLPALAAGAHPDAPLLALARPYERTLAGAEAVSPAHSLAEGAFFAARKANPGLDRATLEKMSGLDVAEKRWQAALDRNGEVIRQIIDTPARTIEGLVFKARICERESLHLDLAESIVADLIAMGGLDA